MKKRLVLLTILLAVSGAAVWLMLFRDQPEAPGQSNQQTKNLGGKSQQITGFDKTKYSTDQPGSIWWIVNKTRPLPTGYIPSDLSVPNVRLRLGKSEEQMHFSQKAIPAVEEMFAGAKKDGVILVFGSGYRSYSYQKTLYTGYVASMGQAEADKTSARPGTSEHQTGLAFDATSASGKCHLDKCFADLPEGRWIKQHAYEYGFIIRYTKDKTPITGYDYEPWHLRYVGRELAAEMHKTGIETLEEFFGLPAAPDYPN